MSVEVEIRVYDHNAVTAGEPVLDYESASYKRVRSGAGPATFTAPLNSVAEDGTVYRSAAIDRVLTAHGNFVPVRTTLLERADDGTETVRDRHDGWVMDYKATGPYGQKTVTTNVVSAFAMLHAILAWSAPGLPLAVQPGYDVYIGPAVTGILSYIQRNADRLGLPLITIAPEGPDTSYLMNWAARFVPIDELIKDTLPELHEWLDVRMWLPGDDPIPGRNLTKATFLVEFVDPPTRSAVVFDEADGGVVAEVAGTTPEAGTIICGGKSPDWLNKVLSDAAETFWPGWGQAFKDIFFAFQETRNPDRGGWGVLAPREALKTGGTAAYTADTFQAGRQGMVEAGGRRRSTFTFVDGLPFAYGVDFELGDIIGGLTELDPDVVWDYVGAVDVMADSSGDVQVGATVGEDRPVQDLVAKLIGRFKNLDSMIKTVFQGT